MTSVVALEIYFLANDKATKLYIWWLTNNWNT